MHDAQLLSFVPHSLELWPFLRPISLFQILGHPAAHFDIRHYSFCLLEEEKGEDRLFNSGASAKRETETITGLPLQFRVIFVRFSLYSCALPYNLLPTYYLKFSHHLNLFPP